MRTISESAISLKDFAGLFLALAAVASAVILLFAIGNMQEQADLRRDHTREVFRESEQLRICTAQANTNVRNYLMTGKAKYLTLYAGAKESLQSQIVQLLEETHNKTVQSLLLLKLLPDLHSFIHSSDYLLNAHKSRLEESDALQKQENAGASLLNTLSTVQQEQLKLLQLRKDRVIDTDNALSEARTFVLIVAGIAIIFSIYTLQTVMKKDRTKILSLQFAVERTQRAEAEALKALAAAQDLNRMKIEFMSNISHEIRTPMTGILGASELLCNLQLDTPAQEYTKTVNESAHQLLNVMDILLNFSQLERNGVKVERKPFAIRQTIKDVANRAEKPAIEKNLSLSTLVDESIPAIITDDEEKIRQALSVLVSNSLKFTDKGSVQIAVEAIENDLIRVSVADTGIGIAREDMVKLFQPFVQLDGGIRRSHGGTGLGLSVAKRLVDLIGGQIGVLSEPGMGSIFWFTFKGVGP